MTNKIVSRFIIATFVTLYTLVSVISTIHVIDFYELSNPYWLAVTLAIGFELGAAASLASLVILDRMNKTLVWALFITITLMQMQGNMYYAFVNLDDFQSWSELFNLIEEEPLYQKRILAFVSGAILPLVALGFIKSLVDYIKPTEDELISNDITGFSDIARDEDLEDEEYFDEDLFDEDLFDDLERQYTEDDDLTSNPTEEQLRDAEEALDNWRDEKLGNIDEDWDEDHALDQVLNDMVVEVESDVDDLEPWDGTLMDGLDDLEEDEDWHSARFDEPEENEDLSLEKALEKRAEEEKEEYLKNKDNAKS